MNGENTKTYWGAFAAPIVVIDYKVNVENFQNMLEKRMLPNTYFDTSGVWTFQQDNASFYVSQPTKAWSEANGVQALDWPCKIPDLNPMENICCILLQSVYKEFR